MGVGIDSNEQRRMEALRRAAILDTPPEPEFDAMTSLAARLFDVPISILTFIDEDRQWFKSRVGLELSQTPRTLAFCETTIASDRAYVVEDARAEARFASNSLVYGIPGIRFYAGAPVHDREGIAIGSFAVLDSRPRKLRENELPMLEKLAACASDALRRRGEAADRGEPPFGSSDLRLSFLADRVPALLWTTDHELCVTSCMGGALASLGLRTSDIVGRSLGAFIAASPEDFAYAAHTRALSGECIDYENTWRDRDYMVRIEPLRDAAKQIIGTLGFALDFTDRRRLEMQVLHADRLASMGILLAGIAHEMNNPLSYCTMGIEVARDCIRRFIVNEPAPALDGPSSATVSDSAAKATAALDDALEGACRAGQLVRDLLLFARQQGTPSVPVDVRRAVEASVRIVTQPMLRVAHLQLNLEEAPMVQANESRLVQVFVNLLINAVQAISERPSGNDEIGIAMHHGSGEVVVEVHDTGPGIPAEMRAHLFDPFFTTKPAGVGTGLGLSICRRIVTSMGGRIDVDSQQDRGTTFRVVLPEWREGG